MYMSRLDSLGLLLKDIYPCKLVLFFPSFADIKPPFNLQAGFDIRCIHLFNILFTAFVMNSYQMIFEMAVLRKLSLAHRTLKWPLTSVGLQVPFQLVRPRKRFLTHVTFEGFLAIMDTHMVFDFIFTEETLHTSHSYCFSIIWVCMWHFSLSFREKLASQNSHWNGFSIEWVCMWSLSLSFRENLVSQMSHLNGFSLECVCLWYFSLSFREKLASQNSHWNGFSIECVCMWFLSLSFRKKQVWQISHLKGIAFLLLIDLTEAMPYLPE